MSFWQIIFTCLSASAETLYERVLKSGKIRAAGAANSKHPEMDADYLLKQSAAGKTGSDANDSPEKRSIIF